MKGKSQISPHDDEITLGEVLDIHDAPDERQAVCAEREHRTNKYAVQNDLHIDDWRPHEQQLEIIPHGPFLHREAAFLSFG